MRLAPQPQRQRASGRSAPRPSPGYILPTGLPPVHRAAPRVRAPSPLGAAAPSIVAARAQRQRSGAPKEARSGAAAGGAPRPEDVDPEDGSSTASLATVGVATIKHNGKDYYMLQRELATDRERAQELL